MACSNKALKTDSAYDLIFEIGWFSELVFVSDDERWLGVSTVTPLTFVQAATSRAFYRLQKSAEFTVLE